MKKPRFEDVVQVVRDSQHLRDDKPIGLETRFERDLGITGDDGSELLEAVEKRLDVTFTRETFNLKPNEFLFGPEASIGDFITLFRHRKSVFRSFTVGELYEAVLKELEKSASTS